MYKVKVNSKFDYDIDVKADQLVVNGETLILDEHSINAHKKHVLFNNVSYTVEVVSLNKAEKTASIKVNGNIYQINVQDQFDALLKQLGMDNLNSAKVQQVKAPMPGLVLQVLVDADTEVKKGDNLLVLEAMKMENMIKSPADGLVKKVLVKAGDKVEKNQILIQF